MVREKLGSGGRGLFLQNGLSWGSDFVFKNLHKYWYLQCFRHFSALKPRWNANYEFWLYMMKLTKYCIYQCLVHFTARIMVWQVNHVGYCWFWSMLRMILFFCAMFVILPFCIRDFFLNMWTGRQRKDEKGVITLTLQIKSNYLSTKGILKISEQCIC